MGGLGGWGMARFPIRLDNDSGDSLEVFRLVLCRNGGTDP